jgi:hypothetical protein
LLERFDLDAQKAIFVDDNDTMSTQLPRLASMPIISVSGGAAQSPYRRATFMRTIR